MKKSFLSICILLGFGFLSFFDFTSKKELPKGFVYLQDIVPNMVIDLRYLNSENFVGQSIDGYQNEVLIISKPAALALKKVQQEVSKRGLRMKVFDAYRPQKAVDHFVRWTKDLNDTINKQVYYPKIEKADLFKLNYIASKSGHTRGSSIDLTLIDSGDFELDMGTTWDYFGPKSWPSDTTVSINAQKNRAYLRAIMVTHGFIPYAEEWWHFTLDKEPFPDTYFNFDIE